MNVLRRSVLRVSRYGSVPIRLLNEVSKGNKENGEGREETKKKRTRVVL